MSKTDDNLASAFAGESQARNKYTYWANQAKKEGYNYIAKIFEETAMNEMRHAKDEFILLGGIKSTEENLQAAMEGEDYEVVTMYEDFANDAAAEGRKDAERLFRQIQKVEAHHRDRYKALLEMVKAGTVYKRDTPITWKCSVCGYIVESTEPPKKCPCCSHPKEYFEPANMDII
ncbi:MAG: rubrerythrin family protein [Spirochaetales bacterium]|uniref:Rubrerythrin family protein n=1 Tax=Candidatus Thalassospirochaeta sargassi TaxID=3119039 RepID=A0AAJ1MJ80_9SPIO|nr:rubrerythrin family protein [Spirochaetales bacterium]